jgi:type II secretory pathway pseudopilin PulG
MLVVVVMIGLLVAVVVPRFRISPQARVRAAADQMVRDLELARARALGTRSWTRVIFDPATSSYTGFLDFNRDSIFAQSAEESDSLHGFSSRTLDSKVIFGRGAAPDVPSLPGAGAITFANSRIDFDARGLTNPFGTKGVIYLLHRDDPTAMAAVTVSGAAGVRTWLYDGAAWR